MGAVRAFDYSRSAAPAFAPQHTPRTTVTTIAGTGIQTRPTISLGLVVTVLAVAMVLFTVLACVRIGIMGATVATSLETQQITTEISEARDKGVSLEVTQSSLTNSERIKQSAKQLGMSAPYEVGTISLSTDCVALNDNGEISLAGSARAAAGIEE